MPEEKLYQEVVREGARVYAADARDKWLMSALGLAGETGELIELVKKRMFHGTAWDRQKFVDELGDVLWYLALLAEMGNTTLRQVATANIAKLRARHPDYYPDPINDVAIVL